MSLTQRSQHTLAQPATINGFGFWSSQDIRLEFHPAEPDTGIVFVRTDLAKPARIPASVENRIEAPRRTTLSAAGAQVEMIEHVMAALAGLQIDNCEVHASAAEMPGVDGSSQPFVQALQAAGVVPQSEPRRVRIVTETIRVGNEDAWIEASPAKHGQITLQYRLDYGPDSPIGRETVRRSIDPQTFAEKIAPARTFILEQEAEWLRQQGLAKRVTTNDVLVFGEAGLIDNQLRMDHECATHKLLDMVGDFALGQCCLIGSFAAYRSGHRLNAQLVQALLAEFPLTTLEEIPNRPVTRASA